MSCIIMVSLIYCFITSLQHIQLYHNRYLTVSMTKTLMTERETLATKISEGFYQSSKTEINRI